MFRRCCHISPSQGLCQPGRKFHSSQGIIQGDCSTRPPKTKGKGVIISRVVVVPPPSPPYSTLRQQPARVSNSPGTCFHPRFGNKILEMHHLFPTLSCPIQKGRQFSILFLYLFIKLSAIFYLLNLAPPRSHPISFFKLAPQEPPKRGCTPGPPVSVL